MLDINKIIIFIFVAILGVYMIRLSHFATRNWQYKTNVFQALFLGLTFLGFATFLDVITPIYTIPSMHIIIRVFFTSGSIIFVLGLIRWISYTKEFILKIEEMSLKDSMLDIYNRKGIEKLFNTAIKNKEAFYMILCDLDGMKNINDKYGHLEGGDTYIKRTVEIMRDIVGDKGDIGRLGGDEFIILLEMEQLDMIEEIITNIKKLVGNIFNGEKTGISMGYSKFPYDGVTIEELLIIADKNMYVDKKLNH